jgi:hypothetical protein
VDPSAVFDFAVYHASKNGHADVVELVLAHPGVDCYGAIEIACSNGHTNTAMVLLADPRVEFTASGGTGYDIVQKAIWNGHPETMSALLDDPRVNLTDQERRDLLQDAVTRGNVDAVSILLARFPVSDARTEELIALCVENGHSEIFKIILHQWEPQEEDELSRTTRLLLLEKTQKVRDLQVVLELLTQSRNSEIEKLVKRELSMSFCTDSSLLSLAVMHVDVLRVIIRKFESSLDRKIKGTLLGYACQTGSADVVRELLDNHQDKFGDWTVDHFNAAAVRGNMPVLRLLISSRYGGFKKLAATPPLNRICTRMVLGESSRILMWCIKMKAKTEPRKMARLLDVLRNLIAGGLLRYEMN